MPSKAIIKNVDTVAELFDDLKSSLTAVEDMANGEFDALPMLARPFANPLREKIELKLGISKKIADKLEKSINSLVNKVN